MLQGCSAKVKPGRDPVCMTVLALMILLSGFYCRRTGRLPINTANTTACDQPDPAWQHAAALWLLLAPLSGLPPSHNLATATDLPPPHAGQVFQVFAALCPAMDLTVGLASGRHSLAAEASALAGLGAGPCSQLDAPPWLQPAAVDVLVATPGRLMHHLQALGSSLLRTLRFLVSQDHLQCMCF